MFWKLFQPSCAMFLVLNIKQSQNRKRKQRKQREQEYRTVQVCTESLWRSASSRIGIELSFPWSPPVPWLVMARDVSWCLVMFAMPPDPRAGTERKDGKAFWICCGFQVTTVMRILRRGGMGNRTYSAYLGFYGFTLHIFSHPFTACFFLCKLHHIGNCKLSQKCVWALGFHIARAAFRSWWTKTQEMVSTVVPSWRSSGSSRSSRSSGCWNALSQCDLTYFLMQVDMVHHQRSALDGHI